MGFSWEGAALPNPPARGLFSRQQPACDRVHTCLALPPQEGSAGPDRSGTPCTLCISIVNRYYQNRRSTCSARVIATSWLSPPEERAARSEGRERLYATTCASPRTGFGPLRMPSLADVAFALPATQTLAPRQTSLPGEELGARKGVASGASGPRRSGRPVRSGRAGQRFQD